MKLRIVTQVNRRNGHRNLFLLGDPATDPMECVVQSESWADADIRVHDALLFTDASVEEAILNHDFRSDANTAGDLKPLDLSEEELRLLEERARERRPNGDPRLS
jgi:hypothetical protein